MTETGPGSTQRFIGLVLVGLSVLWMAFCGLCAIGVVGSSILSGELQGQAIWLAVMVLFVSGLGVAGGYAIFVTGRSLMRGG